MEKANLFNALKINMNSFWIGCSKILIKSTTLFKNIFCDLMIKSGMLYLLLIWHNNRKTSKVNIPLLHGWYPMERFILYRCPTWTWWGRHIFFIRTFFNLVWCATVKHIFFLWERIIIHDKVFQVAEKKKRERKSWGVIVPL